MLDKDTPEIIYKDVQDFLTRPNNIKLMDEGNRLTTCIFVEKFVSKLYGVRKINAWLSKKKGSTFFDLMTVSDIAYVVAVLENSYEVWDIEYNKKRMSMVEWKQYKESDEYTSTKTKFTGRKGRKREYCDSGWSNEGIEFYNDVLKQWKTIAHDNTAGVWENLEEAWELYAEENNFGRVYSRKKTGMDTSAEYDGETPEVEYLPGNRFCMMGEIEDCPWKAIKGDDDEGSDDENGYGSPRKRAKEGNGRLPRVSTDNDSGSLSSGIDDFFVGV